MCVVCRMFGAQVCSVVRWLFGCGLVGLLVVLIVPLFLSFLAMPGLCCILRVTHGFDIVLLGLGNRTIGIDWQRYRHERHKT